MTTIAALWKNGVFAVAADGLCSSNWFISSEKTQKVLIGGGNKLAAQSGDAVVLNFLASMESFHSEAPLPAEGFVADLHCVLNNHGFHLKADGAGAVCCGSSFIYFDGHRPYEIDQSFYWLELEEGVPAAIGSGSVVACGAMDAWCSILGKASDPTTLLKFVVQGVKVASARDAQTGGGICIATAQGGVVDGPRWSEP